MIVGLTGLFCSGKSTAEKILQEEFGFYVIDADKIGHWALTQKKDEIISNFGNDIVFNNDIDRKKLGRIVFNSRKKLILLNSIVHPIMIEKVKDTISSLKNKNILINAALLFEMGLDSFCEKIIVIKACIFNILKRARKRCNYSFFKVFKILDAQNVLKLAKKNRKKADIFYINNNKDINALKIQLKGVFKERI